MTCPIYCDQDNLHYPCESCETCFQQGYVTDLLDLPTDVRNKILSELDEEKEEEDYINALNEEFRSMELPPSEFYDNLH